MTETGRIIASISIAWTIIALFVQFMQARGHRKDYSVQAGSVLQGIIYNFTYAMLPSHKETIRLHPVKFLIGFMMHVGIFLSILKTLIVIVIPHSPYPSLSVYSIIFIFTIAALCAIYLFLRRVFSADLRHLSSIDDYLSILLSLDFILASLLHQIHVIGTSSFLIHASILFFYLPIGKLKHALFFFVARADYGARLGYRGVYTLKRANRD